VTKPKPRLRFTRKDVEAMQTICDATGIGPHDEINDAMDRIERLAARMEALLPPAS
jgi:hypothetical protein